MPTVFSDENTSYLCAFRLFDKTKKYLNWVMGSCGDDDMDGDVVPSRSVSLFLLSDVALPVMTT
jgi:hypothetical protein